MKMTELIILKVYPFTLRCMDIVPCFSPFLRLKQPLDFLCASLDNESLPKSIDL